MYSTSIRGLLLCLGAAGAVSLGLTACSAGAETFDGMLLTFAAQTDADGNCRPERTLKAQVEAIGLYAVRGDANYRMPGGNTNIPFQAVFRGMDNDGFSDDDAVTLLNHPGPCADLVIDIDIGHCEYLGSGKIDKRACPALKVTGVEGFAAVNIVRSDES